jgi:hypothetical protein
MSVQAKTILKNKYWIIEDENRKLGTLSFDNEKYIFSTKTETVFFSDEKELKNKFGVSFVWKDNETTVSTEKKDQWDINGYPTGVKPFKCVYDIKKKLSLFSKSDKSESLYCAGYFILKFPKGWTKAFCPKLVTIEQYAYRGPFKTMVEMKQALSQANKEK